MTKNYHEFLFKKQINMTKRLVAELLRPYGFSPQKINVFDSGIENVSAVVQTDNKAVVIRVYRQKRKSKNWMRLEIRFMDFLRKRGIPVPEVFKGENNRQLSVYNDGKQSWGYIVMEYAPGRHLKTEDMKHITDLAKYQALMHKGAIQFAKRYKIPETSSKSLRSLLLSEMRFAENRCEGSQFLKKANPIIQELSDNIEPQLKKIHQLPHGLVHLDYCDENIVVHRGKVAGIIDFDDIANLPFIMDLANALWWWLYGNRRKNYRFIFQEYIDNYQAMRSLTKKELAFLPLFIRLRNINVAIGVERGAVSGGTKEKENIIAFDEVIKDEFRVFP